jgi:hypothetical protein
MLLSQLERGHPGHALFLERPQWLPPAIEQSTETSIRSSSSEADARLA